MLGDAVTFEGEEAGGVVALARVGELSGGDGGSDGGGVAVSEVRKAVGEGQGRQRSVVLVSGEGNAKGRVGGDGEAGGEA